MVPVLLRIQRGNPAHSELLRPDVCPAREKRRGPLTCLSEPVGWSQTGTLQRTVWTLQGPALAVPWWTWCLVAHLQAQLETLATRPGA